MTSCASPAAWKEWLESVHGEPMTYCSGNVLEIPIAPTNEEEVERRREVAKRCIDAITESEEFKGEKRAQYVKDKMAEIERDFAR